MLLLENKVDLVFQTGIYKGGKFDKIFPLSSVSPVPQQDKTTCE